MKKKTLLLLYLLLSLILIGCTTTDPIESKPTYSIDMFGLDLVETIDTFQLSDLVIVEKDGESVNRIPVDKSMISDEDYQKTKTPGDHKITITYKEYETYVYITLGDSENNKPKYSIDMLGLDLEETTDTFELSDIVIVETIGTTVNRIPLDKSMISDEDYQKTKTPGDHKITIKYKNYETYIYISLLKGEANLEFPEELKAYYNNAFDKEGVELKIALRTIISNVKHVETYGELRQDLAKTDRDPNNPNNIILMYTGKSVSGTWDGGNTWNREHVWPKSLGWFGESGAGADLHHLKPTDPHENSSRGNKKYGTTASYYEPRDEVKGDAARIIFYLMVRYKEADNYTFKSVAESQELLMQWHVLDPVDDFEKNRNEVAYSIQGNRNPFIDYPEYANMIWGN